MATREYGIRSISESYAHSRIWNELLLFRDVEYAQSQLVRLHRTPATQMRNVRKQAVQIGYCIIQAKEYFDAASSTSNATKPVLLYYSAMSLALAQILLFATGDSSLDRARGQHAHHGLTFKYQNPARPANGASSNSLKAIPSNGLAGRYGTFELWRRSAQPSIVPGQVTVMRGQMSTTSHRSFVSPIGATVSLSDDGISLLWCLANLPDMRRVLAAHQLKSNLLRVSIESSHWPNENQRWRDVITVHPAHPDDIIKIKNQFEFHPSFTDSLLIKDGDSGFILEHNYDETSPEERLKTRFPDGLGYSEKVSYFQIASQNSNEFANYYVGLFICGMFSRYYPEKWMAEISANSGLYNLIAAFLDSAVARIPLLALGEMTQTCFIYES